MSVQKKIDEVYQLFILCNRNIIKTLSLTKITRATLNKYIKIQECLDFSLREYLDKKGKEKLKIGDALFLCNNVLNPENQYTIFQNYLSSKNKLDFIQRENVCVICMEHRKNFEFTPCCNGVICENCLSKTFESNIQDIIFKPVNCPFCNKHFNLLFVKWFLIDRFLERNKEFWRKTNEYKLTLEFVSSYNYNLYNKYLTIIDRIERNNDYYITDDEPNFTELLGDKYYGFCTQCTPTFQNRDFRKIQPRQWSRALISDIPKQCGDGEGGLLVIRPEMFRCVVCKSRDENLEDGEFKKCPHCGIKTVKPDGCNYIYCGDHRWCWICNERIENNADGHNKHYWTGPGTSPYSNQCRESINYKDRNSIVQPTFIIKGKCDCSSCQLNGGAPICKNIDCMNRTSLLDENNFHDYCSLCQHLSEKKMLEEIWV